MWPAWRMLRLWTQLAGDPVTVDLNAEGRGCRRRIASAHSARRRQWAGAAAAAERLPATDSLSGTVTLRNANWKADYLANHVEISQATLHLGNGGTRMGPGGFLLRPGERNGEPDPARRLRRAAALPAPVSRCNSAIWMPAPCKRRFWERVSPAPCSPR